MSNYEPDWASPGAAGGAVPTNSGPSTPRTNVPNTASFSGSSRANKANGVQRCLSLLNMGLCAMMITVAVFGLIGMNWGSISNFSDLFVAIYMLLFSSLLLCYELMWWKSIPFVNKSLRKNFGFLYGIKGKSLFIIFIAFLNFGLQNEIQIKGLSLATGIVFFAAAVLQLFIYFWKPELVSSYQAPTAGLADDTGSSPV